MDSWEENVEELSVEECWELLESEEIGRLGYRLVDEVHVVPVNFAVDGRFLLFCTSPGNKLLAAALNSDVAFEIDWYDDDSAYSVLARGHLRLLEEDEQHRADSLALKPWIPRPAYSIVELTPHTVTGRRFRLDPSARRAVPTRG